MPAQSSVVLLENSIQGDEKAWIPACAGMTTRDSRLSVDDFRALGFESFTCVSGNVYKSNSRLAFL